MLLEFKIPGEVKAKQSFKIGRNGFKYTPKDVTSYANWVRTCFYQKYPEHLPSMLADCYLYVTINVYFAIPKSFSKKKIKQAYRGEIKPAKKPDWDNISKNICDALNGIAYPDDKAIVSGRVNKFYSEDAFTVVTIIGEEKQ